MSDLGSLHYFLGIHMVKNKSGLFLYQAKYVANLLVCTGLEFTKPMLSPFVINEPLAASEDSPLIDDPKLYRSLVGALQYLTFTWPDIALAVNQVCQFIHSPHEVHLKAVKGMLRYIKGIVSYGLQLFKSSTPSLLTYSNANWAGCHDTHRSTTGFCIFLKKNLISWSAKK
ncbi:uncharacterized mitochondrial protein AtMg00810-like [Manihot esculenta]|uniref:uncharacterized mitochondrial protein AtMg00810-like n=1 Tax=Manihot esculenta TaxID=3983 RepID=UPI000B5D82A9|nr:uncharacterized mitochondrial protein AtMg00810-like [Manihot esculenta]